MLCASRRAPSRCSRCFFQAEDGIRDYKVTGVQTCALPIYAEGAAAVAGPRGARKRDGIVRHLVGIANLDAVGDLHLGHAGERSEERRVGKEGRGWGWPDRGRIQSAVLYGGGVARGGTEAAR